MLGHFICDTDVSFASVIDRMHRREGLLQSRAIYRGQSNPDWLLQSLWERHFLNPQRAGLYEPYYIQPHDGARVRLQRALLEEFRRQIQLSFPQGTGRSDDELWAIGRHHGLVTPLLDWTLDPYKALHFALRHWAGAQLAVAVWVFHVSETVPPYSRIWNADTFPSPKIDCGYISARQRAQEGVFTRLSDPIFADLEQYLRNRLGDRPASDCLVQIKILPSAIPDLIRELARRGIDEVSLGFAGESDNRWLDDTAARCNTRLIAENPAAVPPTLPKVDQEAIVETAKQLAARFLATIGPGTARPTGLKAFPFLPRPRPRYIS